VLHDAITYVIGALMLAGITGIVLFLRAFAALPRQMIVVQAALFRLLRSNKFQGIALQKIAECQKKGCTNGATEDAVKAVLTDQEKTDNFLRKVALAKPEHLVDLLKEDD
jgi:hypothetical protein